MVLGIKRKNKSLNYTIGKTPGLQINTKNNKSTRITLRGNRSLKGNNQALIIIDGVISSNKYLENLPHEQIISKLISKTTIKKELFNDFNGEIKSLGAWGGDFIMASSEDNPLNYFKNKGYDTVFKFSDLLI